MTNEELDRARVDEAIRAGNGVSVALHAARLAREGWTPPVPVDPEVGSIWRHYNGVVFEVIAIANTLDTEKYPKAVIHKGVENGLVWTRRADDWHRSYTPHVKAEEPSKPVDPDLAEAARLQEYWVDDIIDDIGQRVALAGIKRGRALAAAEAQPGMVWVNHSEAAQIERLRAILMDFIKPFKNYPDDALKDDAKVFPNQALLLRARAALQAGEGE